MELHEWNKNMVNVENCNFLKVNCAFLLVIWMKWKQSLYSITLLYSSTFYSLSLPFFNLEIFKLKYDTFFVRNSAAISIFNWFERLWVSVNKNWKITEGQLYSNQSLVGNWNWLYFDFRQFQKLNQSQIKFNFKLDTLCEWWWLSASKPLKSAFQEMVSMFFSETCYCKYLKLVFVVPRTFYLLHHRIQ